MWTNIYSPQIGQWQQIREPVPPKSGLMNQWVTEHEWLQSSCSPHKYTSAWATTHKRCCPGVPSSTWRWSQDLWILLGFRSFLRLGCFIHFLSFWGMCHLGHNVSTQNPRPLMELPLNVSKQWYSRALKIKMETLTALLWESILHQVSCYEIVTMQRIQGNEHRWEVQSLEARIQPGNTKLMAKTI